MKKKERYFERQPLLLSPKFSNSPDIVVVIPVLNDPDIFTTIDSLSRCDCQEGEMGVIIVVNHGEHCTEELKDANRKLAVELNAYVATKQTLLPKISFWIAEAFNIPRKEAGVGYARKVGMDAAAAFFYYCDKIACPILSLDADTLVEPNYPDAVIRFFKAHAVSGVSIAYAHRLEEVSGAMLDAIVKYELYLRYYQFALQYTGHPHAFHCIGSAFAVRASAYVAEGGMNKRQAGEDFYFLQKLISTGRYAYLNTTIVYPSARFSTRTPFGTGQAVRQIMEQGGSFPVYHLGAFLDLKLFFEGIGLLYKAEKEIIERYFARQAFGVQAFLARVDGLGLVAEANANSGSIQQFTKRFFDHFNAFRVLKYLNQAHEASYQKMDIRQAVETLLRELNYPSSHALSDNLEFLRKV